MQEHLGDHGIWGHSNSLYGQPLRVPLIIRFPGQGPGQVRVQRLATLRDLPVTLLSLAGMRRPVAPGVSLTGRGSVPTSAGATSLAELRVAGRRKIPPTVALLATCIGRP
ncbi:MAG: hypothetical protein IPN47_10270 [Gemmatimonadetes bacterium]|nr:hypothetical protein [Gemmatimonadota bacterium]